MDAGPNNFSVLGRENMLNEKFIWAAFFFVFSISLWLQALREKRALFYSLAIFFTLYSFISLSEAGLFEMGAAVKDSLYDILMIVMLFGIFKDFQNKKKN